MPFICYARLFSCTALNKSASGSARLLDELWIANAPCVLIHFLQGDLYSLAHLGMHEITISYWEHSEFQTVGSTARADSTCAACGHWGLESTSLLAGWRCMFYFQTEGWREAAGSVTLTHMTCGLEKPPKALQTKNSSPLFHNLSKEKPTSPHSMCLFMSNDLHPFFFFIYIFTSLTCQWIRRCSGAWCPLSEISSGKKKGRKTDWRNCFTFRRRVCRPHVSSHLSLVYIHTMTLSLSVGTRCHHLAASSGWLGAG